MKTNRRKLVEKCDAICKKLIKIRDHHTCQYCGKQVTGTNEHWSHIIPVSHGNRLRWNFWNSLVLCFHCHIDFAHKNPLVFTDWFKNKFEERYRFLMNESCKPTVPLKEYEIEDKLEELREVERRQNETSNLVS